MITFLLDCPSEEKFQAFAETYKGIGITVKNYDPTCWVAMVQSEEQNEAAVGALMRILGDFGLVLRCQ